MRTLYFQRWRHVMTALSAWLFCVIALSLAAPATAMPKCLFVSSYHQGYAWSDGVERGLRQTLDGKCEIRQFDMDTKRRKETTQIKEAAQAARHVIASWQPDIVITADDHAARHLIVPFYKDADLPFVFCGVNWSVDEYGFPFSNVTGMVEVAPVRAMIAEARALIPGVSRLLYIGANTSTERKNAARVHKMAERLDIIFDQQFAASLDAWVGAYERGQDYDFIVMGSNAGINDWDEARAIAAIRPVSRRLTVTSHQWMMPVTMMGMTKVPEEQGEWAGKVALQILGGAKPDGIPVIANRKWDLYLNEDLIAAAGIELSDQLLRKGKVFK